VGGETRGIIFGIWFCSSSWLGGRGGKGIFDLLFSRKILEGELVGGGEDVGRVGRGSFDRLKGGFSVLEFWG